MGGPSVTDGPTPAARAFVAEAYFGGVGYAATPPKRGLPAGVVADRCRQKSGSCEAPFFPPPESSPTCFTPWAVSARPRAVFSTRPSRMRNGS